MEYTHHTLDLTGSHRPTLIVARKLIQYRFYIESLTTMIFYTKADELN
jgi:hypothetical protein